MKVFLSYTQTDEAVALRIRNLLSRLPNTRVFDPRQLRPGKAWQKELKQALRECDLFMVLASPEAALSHFVLLEMGAAWGLQKPIVPVRTQEDLPIQMPFATYQSLRLSDLQDQATLNHLLQTGKNGKNAHNVEVLPSVS